MTSPQLQAAEVLVKAARSLLNTRKLAFDAIKYVTNRITRNFKKKFKLVPSSTSGVQKLTISRNGDRCCVVRWTHRRNEYVLEYDFPKIRKTYSVTIPEMSKRPATLKLLKLFVDDPKRGLLSMLDAST